MQSQERESQTHPSKRTSRSGLQFTAGHLSFCNHDDVCLVLQKIRLQSNHSFRTIPLKKSPVGLRQERDGSQSAAPWSTEAVVSSVEPSRSKASPMLQRETRSSSRT